MDQGTVTAFFVLLLAALAGLIPVKIASERGVAGSLVYWWIASTLLFPLALILAIFLKPDQRLLEARALRTGTEKKCPQCAELVKAEALKCRFCTFDFQTQTESGKKKCPRCGEMVLKEAVSCKSCRYLFTPRRSVGG